MTDQPSEGPGITVLIVDDHRDSREIYRAVLEVRGYRVLVAADGEEGRRLIRDRSPDLVLLDRKLPDMDGLELLPDVGEHARVICITARAFEEDRNESLSAGVDCYLAKPVPPRAVLREVERVVGERMRP